MDWIAPPYDHSVARRLARELSLSPITAAILVRRGYGHPAAARAFLEGGESHPPSGFAGIGAVCEGILRHVASGSRIVVHGDYDVDGVCSTAVLVRALRRLGAEPGWYLPSRLDDGYGVSMATVERLAAEQTGLLITVDCGITAVAEVEMALGLGLDVVITDHHRPGPVLPACPIVHPVVSGYPFAELCATAVAHKLAAALHEAAGADPAAADEDLDLVGLATVADVVPLVGENRTLVRAGVRAMSRTAKPGLRALMKASASEPRNVDEQVLGFRLAPRMNAAGRIGRADAALELVLTEDPARAEEVAEELCAANAERRHTETRIAFAAEAVRAEQDHQAAYVLAGEGWHPGVIGIVASRMAERHRRPCVMVALEDGVGRGSGRSIAAYDLHAGLGACSEHLTRFGGHRAAAGLELEEAALPAFRAAFAAHAAGALAPGDLRAVRQVDALAGCAELGLGLAEELGRLGPFGHGNPRPSLLVPAARLSDVRGMGEEASHSRLQVSAGGGRASAVAFRTTPGSLKKSLGSPQDCVVALDMNEWKGVVEPRLDLRGLSPTAAGRCSVVGEELPWSERFLAALGATGGAAAQPGPPVREVVDDRGRGFAGVAGELLSSGASVVVVGAHAGRRRAGVEAILGAIAPVSVCSWDSLPSEGAYDCAVALDPPADEHGPARLAALPGPAGATAHLAWGPAEAEFALMVARAELDCRPALAALYRELREAGGGLAGEPLAALLMGTGAHSRSPAAAALLATVLQGLGLARFGGEELECELLEAAPTELERSASYRAARERLEAFERRELGRIAAAA